MRHRIFALLAVSFFALAPFAAKAADTVTLKFANPGAPNGDVSTQIIQPWVSKVNEGSEGTARVQLFSGPALGQFPQIYDRVLNNVADIAFALLGPLSRQFPKTSVASLPFETPNSRIGTVALWHVYERGLLGSEWDEVKLLTLMVFPNVVIHEKAGASAVRPRRDEAQRPKPASRRYDQPTRRGADHPGGDRSL